MKLSKSFIFNFFFIGLACFTILGILMLLFLDKYYLADNAQFQIVPAASSKKSVAKVYIPENATNIHSAYDGDYISYSQNGIIKVVDMSTGETDIISADKNMSISFYKWVSDRDRIILAEKSTVSSYFKLYYYDVANKNAVEIANAANQSSAKIKAYYSSEQVTDIQISTYTNLIYVKLTKSDGESYIYKMNIMAQGGWVSLPYYKIGTINLLTGDDKLFFENLNTNKVYWHDISGTSSTFTINKDSETKKYFKILGSDSNDVVYLAEYTSGSSKTSNVYYGNDSKGWTVSTFNIPVNISDIIISEDGGIYVNDKDSTELIKINDKTKTGYSGKFIGIYSTGVISVQNNQIIRTAFSTK